MATVTISQLDDIAPTTNTVLPISNGGITGKTTIASLPVDYNNLTNKPTIPSPGLGGMQGFTTAGNYTFTAPAGVTKVKVTVQGSGGGGGGITSNNQCGGNVGASGGYAIGIVNVVAGTGYAVVVGDAGGGGGRGGCGGTGGTSSFNNTSIYATGGTGGCPCGAAGTAGTGVNGQINTTGAYGMGGFGFGSNVVGTVSPYNANGGAGGPGFVIVEW